MKNTVSDSTENFDFIDDDPTRPVPHETLAEVSARWRIAQEADVDPETGIPMQVATSERVTRNIRRPSTESDRLIEQARADLSAGRDWNYDDED